MANLKKTRTRKRGVNRIYSHSDRITYSKKTLQMSGLLPGQVCTFSYKIDDPKNYDKQPLILFLYKDRNTNLIHGINLHYLSEKEVQFLFKSISKHTSINYGKSKNMKEHHVRIDLADKRTSKTPSPMQLYEKVIRPLLNLSAYKNCYRTFSDRNVSGSVRLVNYKLDIIEKEFRKETDLSKGDLSSKELFKATEESEIEIQAGKINEGNDEN